MFISLGVGKKEMDSWVYLEFGVLIGKCWGVREGKGV